MYESELIALLSVSGLAALALSVTWITRRGQAPSAPQLAIDGQHVRLRPVTPGDGDAFAATIDAEVTRAHGWNAETIAALIAGIRDRRSDELVFGIVDRTGALAGVVSLSLDPFLVSAGHIGFWVGPGHRGRGHMTEAVDLVIRLLPRMGLSAVTAHTAVDNLASRRVLEANGLEEHGRYLRVLPNGVEIDAVMYRRLGLAPPSPPFS